MLFSGCRHSLLLPSASSSMQHWNTRHATGGTDDKGPITKQPPRTVRAPARKWSTDCISNSRPPQEAWCIGTDDGWSSIASGPRSTLRLAAAARSSQDETWVRRTGCPLVHRQTGRWASEPSQTAEERRAGGPRGPHPATPRPRPPPGREQVDANLKRSGESL